MKVFQNLMCISLAACLTMFAAPHVTALPTDASTDVAQPISLFSATDSYARFVTDVCVQATGVPIDESAFAPLIRQAATSQGGVIYGAADFKLFAAGAGDPCCVCGIINPDQSIKGCVALMAPCCCQASIKANLEIDCLCQGGRACGD